MMVDLTGTPTNQHRCWARLLTTVRGTHHEVLISPDTLPDRATPSEADTVDSRNEVVRALAQLPLAQRRVVVLRHLLDLTESQTANELAVSIGTVKSHNARALARLRTLLMEGRQ